ncbi:hypothetical protein [Bradyrhizobium sp. SYSU BS000235]|uniref:hypothetical protein n=1 Tax=Bradyrhizobium sp. SYSU BS000235 TaxID=3411332 RepID=UPI003C751008
MFSRPLKPDSICLRRLVIFLGLGWSVAFVALALANQLELYGDGAMFSYAVAVRDVWAFHWHNISGRMAVYLLTLLPAEMLVGLTGNPWAGIIAYGAVFYIAPLVGLVLTYAADRSQGRLLFVYACGSTALLCPLIFGFPTEMWFAHAIFWPTLALSHYAKPTLAGAVLVLVAWVLLAFCHEGALVLLLAILGTLALRGLRSKVFLRGALTLAIVMTLAIAAKVFLPPDSYYADAFVRAALHFFDPELFKVEVVVSLLSAIAAYAVIHVAISRWNPQRACIVALVAVFGLLSIYWIGFDDAIHANSRYYLRTALVLATPLLGGLAALAAMTREGIVFARLGRLQKAITTPSKRSLCAGASIFAVVFAINIVQTSKFIAGWSAYRNAIAALAMSDEADASLGSAEFVSSRRLSPSLERLAWFSTIPYLSIILADFSPKRLVIDPKGNYFWLSCETATRNKDAKLAVPEQTRELVRVYSCLHR